MCPAVVPTLQTRLPRPCRHFISGWRLRAASCPATVKGDLKQSACGLGPVSSLVMEVNPSRRSSKERAALKNERPEEGQAARLQVARPALPDELRQSRGSPP